ncbi:MAG: DUF4038 domain-containing protein [Bryobacteraceae bacterium]|nr:DUF4038 domain-containing protein [Bryobacteraceae bacterium]
MRLSRRTFLGGAALSGMLQGQALQAAVHRPLEWSFTSARSYGNPFTDVELDVVVREPGGDELRIPAFWAGEREWRVRYAPAKPGAHSWRSVGSDANDAGLHDRRGTIEAAPYDGTNPLYRNGPIRVASDRRRFEHADGTPFFWLGDTWWMGLVRRLRWPEDFQLLTADRRAKGFSVIQIVAGLYPDMGERDLRGANEAGFPYNEDYTRVNPAYFDMADLRIRHLADSGLAPCVVGCWGYYLPILGVEKMKRHWRYVAARWGAYPVVWCLAGEGSMPYYLSKNRDADTTAQKTGWTELGRYLRSIDPYRRPITIHPSTSARATVDDPGVLDFDMLQTGHSDRDSIPNTLKLAMSAYAAAPTMPVINGEVCYEGILEASRQEVQRFMFWSCVLSGAAGHTYGANGIWQVNTPERPFGASPHGRNWGETPWQTAYRLPGSAQLAMAKSLLMKYPWRRMSPQPDWIEPHGSPENYMQPYGAGIPGELRIFYFPRTGRVDHKVKAIEPGVEYRAYWWNPATGAVTEIENVTPAGGEWQPPPPPIFQDYVLVMENV